MDKLVSILKIRQSSIDYKSIQKYIENFPKLNKDTRYSIDVLSTSITETFLKNLQILKSISKNLVFQGITVNITDNTFDFYRLLEIVNNLNLSCHIKIPSNLLEYYGYFDLNAIKKTHRLTIFTDNKNDTDVVSFLNRYPYYNVNYESNNNNTDSFRNVFTDPKRHIITKKSSKNVKCNDIISIYLLDNNSFIRLGYLCCANINSYKLDYFLDNIEQTDTFKRYLETEYIECFNENRLKSIEEIDNNTNDKSNESMYILWDSIHSMETIKSIKSVKYDDLYDVKWHITKWCNYKCSYCIQKHTANDSIEYKLPSITELLLKANLIKDYLIKNGITNTKLNLIGGEVSFLKFGEIFSVFSGNLKQATLTTNLSSSIDHLTKQIELLFNTYSNDTNFKQFLLTASYHEEFCNFDDFFNKVFSLHKRFSIERFSLVIQFTVTNSNISMAKQVYEICKKHKLKTNFAIDRNLNDRSNELLNFMDSFKKESANSGYYVEYQDNHVIAYSSQYIKNNINRFNGWKCYVPKSTLIIDPLFYWSNTTCKALPKTNYENFNSYEKDYIICNKEKCALCDNIKVEKC